MKNGKIIFCLIVFLLMNTSSVFATDYAACEKNCNGIYGHSPELLRSCKKGVNKYGYSKAQGNTFPDCERLCATKMGSIMKQFQHGINAGENRQACIDGCRMCK